MSSLVDLTFSSAILVLIQLLAALPWLAVVFLQPDDWRTAFNNLKRKQILINLGIGLLAGLVGLVLLRMLVQSQEGLEWTGRVYAVVLQCSLIADFFVAVFVLMQVFWPKGGAVALSAFREGVRQSMFWLLVIIAVGLMFIWPFLPYFTFGEDHIMVKELGHDTIILAGVLFGALAATLFISEEIEGRTAITVMSKPVSRREFLLGKFLGILLATLVLFGMLGTYFEGIQLLKHWWDKKDPVPPPPWVISALESWDFSGQTNDFLRGVGLWTALTLETLPGLILSFSQVMILIAISVALATRLTMVVNISLVVVVYFLSNLTPVLMAISKRQEDENFTVSRILGFTSGVMDTFLPDLDAFRIDASLISDAPLPTLPFIQYVASVTLYGVLYTLVVLFFGLILFEDRDLA